MSRRKMRKTRNTVGFRTTSTGGIVCQGEALSFSFAADIIKSFIIFHRTTSIMGCKTQFLKRYHFNLPFREALAFRIYLSILESITCPMYSDCVWEKNPVWVNWLTLEKGVLNSEMMCGVGFECRDGGGCSAVKQGGMLGSCCCCWLTKSCPTVYWGLALASFLSII